MRTARTLEAEWKHVLWGSMSMGTKKYESSTGRIWAAGYHYVIALSRLVHILKLMNHLFLQFSNSFLGHGKPWITETIDIESVDIGAQLYLYCIALSGNMMHYWSITFLQHAVPKRDTKQI
jgi:hypothetical protein